MTQQAPAFGARLAASVALWFGGLAANVAFGAVVTPWIPGWLLGALAPGFVLLGFAAWTLGAVAVTGGRLLAGRPLQADGEVRVDPANPSDVLSYPPGTGWLPMALGAGGTLAGSAIALVYGSPAPTAAALGVLGAAWGATLRALARRGLLAHDL